MKNIVTKSTQRVVNSAIQSAALLARDMPLTAAAARAQPQCIHQHSLTPLTTLVLQKPGALAAAEGSGYAG